MKFVRLDPPHPQGPQQTARPASAASEQAVVGRKAGPGIPGLGSGPQDGGPRGGLTERRDLGGAVGGPRPLVLYGSYDVLVGRQLGRAVAEVALADGVGATGDDLLVTRHGVRGSVSRSAGEKVRRKDI